MGIGCTNDFNYFTSQINYPKQFMKQLFPVLLLLLSNTVFSQNYIIRHDLQKEQTKYLRVGKHNDTTKVNSINISKNGRIILQVDNYNPYYWNARVTAYKKPVDNQSSSGGAFNPFSFLAQGFGSFISSALPKMDMPKPNSEGYNAQTSTATINAMTLYKKNYEQLVVMENKLNELENLKLKLNALKYDVIKDEATIKREAQEAVDKVLGSSKLEFEDAFSIGNRLDNTLQATIDSSVLLQGMLPKPPVGEAAIMVRNADGKLMTIQKFNEENPHPFLDKVNAVAALYRDISNASFKYAYVVNADPDITDLKLELFSKIDGDRKDTIVKYFSVKGKGNFKLRNSMGIAFTYFADNNRTYFVDPNSNAIVQDKGDFFTPVLSTFIHFYGGGGARLKWGGALGFGIPLQGAQKDINFLLGLSAILGNNEPIMITAGISGAKVNKLDKGYKTGDIVNSSFVIPTRSVYQPGAFLAVSFNFNAITRRN